MTRGERIGVYEKGKYKSKTNNEHTKEYRLWKNMLTRCYNKGFQSKQPMYIGCSASENFKKFQFFAEWCQSQVGFGEEGYALDKDLILVGNKMYSEDTCVFIPRVINNIVAKANCLGVRYRERYGKFVAQISMYGKKIHIGYFDNKEEAEAAHRIVKCQHILQAAEEYKKCIDIRAYDSLIRIASQGDFNV